MPRFSIRSEQPNSAVRRRANDLRLSRLKDLEFLSDGLEGRSRNPVSLLMDHLIHPDADLGARLQSKLKWRHEPTSTVDHVCLGRGGIGGVWNQLTSKHLQTVSMANWMELPNYSMGTFQQQRRARLGLRPDPPARATYDEVRAYYIHYVRRQRLTGNFSNGCEVTSMERVCPDAPFYDDRTGEIRTAEPIWKISGHDELTRATFVIHAKYVVLATGLSQEITRPLGLIGEQTSQSFTYTNLYAIENLIVNEKRLTTNSKSLLVIGCGLAAIDVILLCQQHSIPVLHVFRRAIDDHELVFNQLSATVFPDYERIKELIRQSSTVRLSRLAVDRLTFVLMFFLVAKRRVLSVLSANRSACHHGGRHGASATPSHPDDDGTRDLVRCPTHGC